MKSDVERKKELEEFRKALEKCDDKDFDGHSEFEKLTAKEKLIWLSQLNYFKYIVKK